MTSTNPPPCGERAAHRARQHGGRSRTVKLANVPPSVLLRPQSTAQAAPVNETPVNETPVNETPVNELPVNDLPINETPVNDLGFDDLAATVPALGNITLASIPLLRHGRLDRGSRRGTPLAGAAAPERHAARLLRAADASTPRRARRTRSRRSRSATSTSAQPARQPARERARAREREALGHARRSTRGASLFGTAYCPTGVAHGRDGHVCGAAGRAGERDAGERDARQRDAVNEIPVNDVPVNETPVNEVPVNELPVNETPVNELPVNETPVNEMPVNELP